MKKIISLFERDYQGNRQVIDEVVPGAEWVINGGGWATIKHDGTACMVRDGRLYKRYDCKPGRTPPADFEPCEENPDGHTGHWPGWVPVGDGPEDKYHREAFAGGDLVDGTYELVGPKVQSNPYGLETHQLWAHGKDRIVAPRTFKQLRDFFAQNHIEGIVWHDELGCMVKIKRRDFGYEWPIY